MTDYDIAAGHAFAAGLRLFLEQGGFLQLADAFAVEASTATYEVTWTLETARNPSPGPGWVPFAWDERGNVCWRRRV